MINVVLLLQNDIRKYILPCIVDIVVDSKIIQFDMSFPPITYNKLPTGLRFCILP
jgi:hypothetical protein